MRTKSKRDIALLLLNCDQDHHAREQELAAAK